MIYFVGIHHKKGLPALSSTTRSGKKIDSVIDIIRIESFKINLFSTDYIPNIKTGEYKCEIEKFLQAVPDIDNIIVLLGNDVNKHFPHRSYNNAKIIKFRHPAFSGSNYSKDLAKAILT